MSKANIPVSKKAYDTLNKERFKQSAEKGKKVTWSEFLLSFLQNTSSKDSVGEKFI